MSNTTTAPAKRKRRGTEVRQRTAAVLVRLTPDELAQLRAASEGRPLAGLARELLVRELLGEVSTAA